ncbi:MAG TPA: ATP-binding protein [Gemmataceae bacterium]|jgi:signal transduction histidine kinase/HAMP domain-containing protein
MTLRQRIVLALAPLVCLLALIAATGIVLLRHVGSRIEDILHENYVSVEAMAGLNEGLERIDSSFQFALQGKKDARNEYEQSWIVYNENLKREQNNVTEAGEQDLVDRLSELTKEYRKKGDEFFDAPADRPGRAEEYFGSEDKRGLLQCFRDIKEVAGTIRQLNKDSMERASDEAKRTAIISQVALGIGLVVTVGLAGLLVWSTTRAVLGPIQAVTRSAIAIGGGDLNQAVPVLSRDEMGQLAEAFNRMSRQLRDYRDSHSARLLRVQRTSQATIDSFPEPVLVVDPSGHVEMANPAAHRLLGIAPPLGQAATYTWLPPVALRQPLDDALRKHRPFLTQAFDQTVTFRYNGEDRAYLPQILPIQDPFGITLGAAVVLNDVTRFRLLDQIKSDLVATVSHELKTPLTSVRLVLHLLLEETVGPLTAKQTELLIDARDNAERLLNMIEHLLALARLEQGRESLQLRAGSPQSLLEAAAQTARTRAESKHVQLIVEDASQVPPVLADPVRLGHALDNLLDNALTYTDQGGRITLSASALDKQTVRLSVADTGVGIPAEHLPHVFNKFFRVPDQSRGHGTGLGLAIVREIVLAHGGQVSCESQVGQGTTFHLMLPIGNEQLTTEPQRTQRKDTQRTK